MGNFDSTGASRFEAQRFESMDRGAHDLRALRLLADLRGLLLCGGAAGLGKK